MKKFFEEFKAFAMRGNVLDMAVGVVIGGAFGKITTSLVNDIIMPLISMLTGGVDFSAWKWVLKEAVMEGSKVVTPEVAVNYGNLIAVILDFIIIAFAVFCMVKAVNKMHDKLSKPAEPESEKAPEPTKEEVLLTEISAALLPFVDLTGKTVVDVGTGAGFPGMPLRILEDDFDLTLLDSLGKRVNWLQEVCDELQLKRVACVHARAEEFAMQHREQFDIAASRAVAQLSILSELCLPLIKVGGQFIAMKSVDTEDEIAAAKSAIKTLGGHIVKVEDYTIPTSDVVHRLVIVEKVSPTPRAYPRAFAKIKKAPL